MATKSIENVYTDQFIQNEPIDPLAEFKASLEVEYSNQYMPREVFEEKIADKMLLDKGTLDKIISKFETEIDNKKHVEFRKAIDLIYAVKKSGIKIRLSKLNLGKMSSRDEK